MTIEEGYRFLQHLEEPFHTIGTVQLCFGLRISELLGLKWSDVDWLRGELRIQRSIVRQRVGETKTAGSRKPMKIADEMLELLKGWKQKSQFSGEDDWVFASPVKLGRQPWCADAIGRAYQKAATVAGVGHVGTHSLRHTFRSWLDAVGTPITVQQKLMRHTDIATTMNRYGDVVTDQMADAQSKVARLALFGTQTARKPS
jgi:integrase